MLHPPELISGFGHFLKIIGKKEATVQSYCQDLTQFLEFLAENNLSLASTDNKTLSHYRTSLWERNSGGKQNSFRRSVIAIRQFYRWHANSNPEKFASADCLVIPERIEALPPKLLDRDIDSLLKATERSSPLKATRDRAILMLLCFEGVKVSELISLEWKHLLLHPNESTLTIPGERGRLLILNKQTSQILDEYQKSVATYEPTIPKHYRMLLGFKGRDLAVLAPHVTRHGLKFMLYELGQACQIPHLNSEMLRHHAIQYQLERGLEPEKIMKHLGLKRMGNIAKHHRLCTKHAPN